jgi:predicted O-linked N-acetylglucosamine transferase (SPINDLY family)
VPPLSIETALKTAAEHHTAGRLADAGAIYQQILSQNPNHPDALHRLGLVAFQLGQNDAAVDLIRKAIVSQPNDAAYHLNLALALQARGDLDSAIASFSKAIQIRPDLVEAHHNLGKALRQQGNYDQAAVVLREAIALNPEHAESHNTLGLVLRAQSKLSDAAAEYARALQIRPDYPDALNNLGNVLREQAKLDEAIACYDRAIALRPDDAMIHSNKIYTLHDHPDYDAATILQEHRQWNLRHAKHLREDVTFPNDPSPHRRIRIGYVSPDFRNHPVGRFLLPLFDHHNHESVEVYCYHDAPADDAVTQRLRSRADVWRSTVGIPHDKFATLVRQDRIDILVDLTMHMAHNRLLAFARKPAPVQVTYLAYCSTTGLDAIDYRLTDPYLDPPGHGDENYSEKSIRLPRTYWCYEPIASPPLSAPPSIETGHVTFACLNNFCKVTSPTLKAWRQLLQAVPRSRLFLHAKEGDHQQRVRDLFANDGIDPQRLIFAGYKPVDQYLQSYNQIDIALDPFPCAGGTTTCDALWMGVPIVTLAGHTAVGRSGFSILSNINLPDLIAISSEQYVQIAANLAADEARLKILRSDLRKRMTLSPLMDGHQFAKDIENAYRCMWKQWCETHRGERQL